jgi:hypothetical protein
VDGGMDPACTLLGGAHFLSGAKEVQDTSYPNKLLREKSKKDHFFRCPLFQLEIDYILHQPTAITSNLN